MLKHLLFFVTLKINDLHLIVYSMGSRVASTNEIIVLLKTNLFDKDNVYSF